MQASLVLLHFTDVHISQIEGKTLLFLGVGLERNSQYLQALPVLSVCDKMPMHNFI